MLRLRPDRGADLNLNWNLNAVQMHGLGSSVLIMSVVAHTVLGQYPVLSNNGAVGYSVPANGVQIFKMAIAAADVPEVGSCSDLNCEGPENMHNRLVCAGPCPAGCECSDGWAIEIMAGVGSNNPALAFSLSNTAIQRSTAYNDFVRGEWRVVPFVTAHEHFTHVGTKGTGRLELDMVDLCMPTAMKAKYHGRSQPVLFNYSQMDCNCDDCAHSCGLTGSRKGSLADGQEICPQPWPYEMHDAPSNRGCVRHSACAMNPSSGRRRSVDYSLCTFYSASQELSRSSYNADFCCNGHPKAFEDAIGALPGLKHPFGFMEEYAAPKVTFPVASIVNLTACEDDDGVSEITDYILPPVMYMECSRSDMQAGDYYLYVVNTGNETAGLTLGYNVRLLTPAETHICVVTEDVQSAANRQVGSLAAVVLLLALSYL